VLLFNLYSGDKQYSTSWYLSHIGGPLTPMQCAPAAAPQVAKSPVVLRLIVIGSFSKKSVDMELEEDPDLIAFSIFVPGS
jgi:hypothetical protein